MTGRKVESNPLARYVGVIERRPRDGAEPQDEEGLRARLQELQGQLEEERARVQQLEGDLKSKTEALAGAGTVTDEDRKALETRIQELEESLNRIKDEYAKKMKNTIALTKIKYEKEIDKLRKDLKKFALNAGVDETEMRSRQQTLESQEDKIAQKASDLASREKELEDLRDLKKRVDSGQIAGGAAGTAGEAVRRENETLKARLDTTEVELLNLKKGSVAMLKYATQMQAKRQEDELKKLRESLEAEMQTRMKLEEEIRKREEELAARELTLRKRLEQASTSKTQDTSLLRTLEEEVRQRSEELKTREEKLKNKEREIIEKIKGLETEIRQKIKDGKIIQDIKREFAQKEEEIKRVAMALRQKEEELASRESTMTKGGATAVVQSGVASAPASTEALAQLKMKDDEILDLKDMIGALRTELGKREDALAKSSGSPGQAAGTATLALSEEIKRLRTELDQRNEEFRRMVDPVKYKEEEFKRRQVELEHRETVLQEELKKMQFAQAQWATQQEMKMKQRLEELEANVKQKEEEIVAKETFLRNKEDELRRRADSLVSGEVAAREEERQAEFKVQKAKMGNPRIDDLLYGGVPFGAQCLVMGPPFIGKETMSDCFLAEGIKKGIPCIYITTDTSPADIRDEFRHVLPDIENFEKLGLVKFIDVYSKAMGVEETDPNVINVEHPTDYKGIMLAMTQFEREFKERGITNYRMQVRSISTLVTYSDPTNTYRFLQGLAGRAKRGKVVGLYLLDKGMHSETEIQTIGHVMDGAFEFKTDGVKTFFIVQGVGDVQSRTWIQYQYSKKGLNVGSFTLDRIQ